MRWGVAVVALASLWLGSVRSFAAEAPPPAASAFGRVPAMESVALSPNGQLIAWVENSGAQSIIQVLDLAKGAQVRRVDVPGNLKVHGLDWADDEILLIHDLVRRTYGAIESPVSEWLRTAAMEVATGKSRLLLVKSANMFHVPAARLLALHPSKPRTVIMSSWTFAGLRPDGESVRRGNNFSQGSRPVRSRYADGRRQGDPLGHGIHE